MNKKLMIVMLAVGASALYVRFQVVGMDKKAAAVALGEVEQVAPRSSEGFYGFLRPKNAADEEAKNRALELNMGHGSFPPEMREKVLSRLLPPKVMAFLYHKLCIPKIVQTLSAEQLLPGQIIESVAFSPDGKLLATGSTGGIGIWDVASGQILQTLQQGSRVLSVAFSPDGRLLAIGFADRTAAIWDVENWNILKMLQCEGDRPIRSVAFSPDGRLLATGSNDTAKIWHVASEEKLQTLQYRGKRKLLSVAFSADGTRLSIALNDGAIDILNIASGEIVQTLRYHHSAYSVAFSVDGTKVAIADTRTAGIWDIASGEKLQTLEDASLVAFSLDGTKLATSNFRRMAIWDVRSGNRLQTLDHGPIFSLIFSPDGKLLATAIGVNAFLWNMECLQTVERLILTTFAQYTLMEELEKTFVNKPNGTVRIVAKLNATPEQWEVFETLSVEVQEALRPLIRNEEEQEKVADYWRRKAIAAAAAGDNPSKCRKVDPEERRGSDTDSDDIEGVL